MALGIFEYPSNQVAFTFAFWWWQSCLWLSVSHGIAFLLLRILIRRHLNIGISLSSSVILMFLKLDVSQCAGQKSIYLQVMCSRFTLHFGHNQLDEPLNHSGCHLRVSFLKVVQIPDATITTGLSKNSTQVPARVLKDISSSEMSFKMWCMFKVEVKTNIDYSFDLHQEKYECEWRDILQIWKGNG